MPVTYKHTMLPNGLEVVAEVDPAAHTAAIGFYVKTGARDESSDLMGVSHFLEHMMFKGTETRGAEDVDRAFDDIGADHNAFTTTEMTAFWAHVLPEHLPTATEILADILRPSIREADFDDEKQVILEEIAMYRDQPFWVLYERAMEVYYRAHPMAHRVLGTDETVGELTRDEMLRYFRDRYSADNTVAALAGRLDFDGTVEQLAAQTGHWERTETKRSHTTPDLVDDEFTISTDKVNRHYILMLAPAPALDDDRRYAAGMLGQILGDVDGSRLYWALIETGLAEEAAAQYDGHDGLGDYLVYVSCSPDDAAAVEQATRDEIDTLRDSLTEDDLERTRSKVATAVTLAGELPSGRMRRLGRLSTYGLEYRTLEQELDRISAVTLDELREVHDAFPLKPVVTGRLAP